MYTQNSIVPFDHVSYKFKEDLQLSADVYAGEFLQFIHTIFGKDGFSTKRKDIFIPLMDHFLTQLHMEILITSKINITFPDIANFLAGFHVDFEYENTPNYKTGLFYLSDTDGYTVLEDGTRVECVKNRLVIFNGSIFHSGTTCTNKNRRTTLNFNYIGKDI